ncbi:MAG: hypothetical protein ABW189_07410 [Rickettsiales bacterium]
MSSITIDLNGNDPVAALNGFAKGTTFDTLTFILAVMVADDVSQSLDDNDNFREKIFPALSAAINQLQFSATHVILDILGEINGKKTSKALGCQEGGSFSAGNFLALIINDLQPKSLEIRESGRHDYLPTLSPSRIFFNKLPSIDINADVGKRKVKLSFPANAFSEHIDWDAMPQWIASYVVTPPSQGVVKWMQGNNWMVTEHGAHVSDLLILMEEWRREDPENRKIQGCFHLTLDVIAHVWRMPDQKPTTFLGKTNNFFKSSLKAKKTPEERLCAIIREWISSSDDWVKDVSGDFTFRLLPMRFNKSKCENSEWIAFYVKALEFIAQEAGPERLQQISDCKILSRCLQWNNGAISEHPCRVDKRDACPHCFMYVYFHDVVFANAFNTVFCSPTSLTMDMPSLASVKAFSALPYFRNQKALTVRMNPWISGAGVEEGEDATQETQRALTPEALSLVNFKLLETLTWEFPSALCPRNYLMANYYGPAFHYAHDVALKVIENALRSDTCPLSSLTVKDIIPSDDLKKFTSFFHAISTRDLTELTLNFPQFPCFSQEDIGALAKKMIYWKVDVLNISLHNRPHTICNMRPGKVGQVSGSTTYHDLVTAYLKEADCAIISD